MYSAMIGLLFLALAVVHSQSAAVENYVEKIKQAKDVCATEHNVDVEIFKKLWKEHKIPESEHGCFMMCIMKKVGFFVDGKFDREAVKMSVEQKWVDAADKEKAHAINEVCIDEVKTDGKDECHVAHEVVTCFVQESQKRELAPPGKHESEE
uniref:Odorant binding protein 5 n=1 Tax=Cyrtorhinus lividipennis TaxID=1032904 RepID=A0A1W6AWH3_9HEMI|nr:odorant binding protein 5 [Cyrtorhinus lividipennis]